MSCDHLICAHCAGPVVEGRCPVCRAGREKIHHQGPAGLSPLLVALALLLVLIALIAARHLTGGL
ncbi:hypothetical protein GCM10010106_37580 [Thermopolyspora flexuosa]|jgi:hypothetical protein|uniref:RING-type domain-containing protein n=1 Tax=Thermopolyspora flexuosa TaxID=103836 RepID=A0A543J1Y5_9ACTN|nr:hypothetical protein [Thermopolyspora flexuosa]TQM76802.1 hypothetical protein FHX40_3551 [Thermopolyspora flexuosa]GGM86872.1 hypothetical protein GCM10010106_37580 [Thermopolyspora flexuosa]